MDAVARQPIGHVQRRTPRRARAHEQSQQLPVRQRGGASTAQALSRTLLERKMTYASKQRDGVARTQRGSLLPSGIAPSPGFGADRESVPMG
jgi:hypothetical protein